MNIAALTDGGVPVQMVEKLAGEQGAEPTPAGMEVLKDAMEVQRQLAAELLKSMGIGTLVDVRA